jgi:hypothetical protein
MRSVKLVVAGAVVALALSACSSSSKSSNGPTTTAKPITTADFCAQVKSQVEAFDFTGLTRRSKADLKRIYNESADQLDALAAAAPPEIHQDMQTVVNIVKQLHAELADAGYDPSQLSLSAIPGLTSPSSIAATAHVASYFRDTCHIVSAQSDG